MSIYLLLSSLTASKIFLREIAIQILLRKFFLLRREIRPSLSKIMEAVQLLRLYIHRVWSPLLQVPCELLRETLAARRLMFHQLSYRISISGIHSNPLLLRQEGKSNQILVMLPDPRIFPLPLRTRGQESTIGLRLQFLKSLSPQ